MNTRMKTNKYFLISMFALLAYGCQDEEPGSVQPTPGEEVKFGAVLEKNVTRTIYGDENTNGVPIYWVDGDEVIVSSPQCGQEGGVGFAFYKVKVDGATQDYATSLDKTGETGLRWGDNATGDFYSVYPSSSLYTNLNADNKTYRLIMPAQQDNNIVTENGKKIVRSDMRSCFMYARTPNVPNGDVVNLKYVPLSTALRFTLQGPQTGDPVTINYIRIYAPQGTNISGTYDVDLSTVSESGLPNMTVVNGRNYVTMNVADASTSAYLTLAQGESIDLNIFMLIAQNTTITDDWYIEVAVDGVNYTMNFDASSLEDNEKTLVPGKVHRLKEALPPLTSSEWDPANWMANLQRNVYLSEISIPGSWNSMNSDCQYSDNATNIEAQYNAGIRAFHIDTRWKAGSHLDWGITTNYAKIEGLGVADGSESGAYIDWDGVGTANRLMNCHAPNFSDVLNEITRHVKSNEYMVVICTIAQDSYDYNRENGGWKKEISDICANNSAVLDASTITPETVVQDVLGNVIVIVNTNNEFQLDGSKCLFMDMGVTLDETEYTETYRDYYKKPLNRGNGVWSGITMYAAHAQITMPTTGQVYGNRGYAPTLSERQSKSENILSWSKENYSDIANYGHDAWIYMGLGGYVQDGSEQYATVTNYFNNYLNGKLTDMETNGYYPIGIVLMNDAVSDATSATAKEILMLNNKYRKAYDPNRSPVDGSDITRGKVQSVAPGYSSGMTDNGKDAIGWTRCK